MLSVGSRRNSDNEYPDDRTRDGERSTTKTCCDGVVARSASRLSDVHSTPGAGAQLDQRIRQHGRRGQSPTDQVNFALKAIAVKDVNGREIRQRMHVINTPGASLNNDRYIAKQVIVGDRQ